MFTRKLPPPTVQLGAARVTVTRGLAPDLAANSAKDRGRSLIAALKNPNAARLAKLYTDTLADNADTQAAISATRDAASEQADIAAALSAGELPAVASPATLIAADAYATVQLISQVDGDGEIGMQLAAAQKAAANAASELEAAADTAQQRLDKATRDLLPRIAEAAFAHATPASLAALVQRNIGQHLRGDYADLCSKAAAADEPETVLSHLARGKSAFAAAARATETKRKQARRSLATARTNARLQEAYND